jgi:hypothetical protein
MTNDEKMAKLVERVRRDLVAMVAMHGLLTRTAQTPLKDIPVAAKDLADAYIAQAGPLIDDELIDDELLS